MQMEASLSNGSSAQRPPSKHPSHGKWVQDNKHEILALFFSQLQDVGFVDLPTASRQGRWTWEQLEDVLRHDFECKKRDSDSLEKQEAVKKTCEYALEMWPPGRRVFVLRAEGDFFPNAVGRWLRVKDVVIEGTKKFKELMAKDVHNIHGFPGATIMRPMNTSVWYDDLQYWFLRSVFRGVSLSLTANVMINIVRKDDPYGKMSEGPLRFSQLVCLVQVVALVIEIMLVGYRTFKGEEKVLQKIQKIPDCFIAINRWLRHFLTSFMLRFFSTPHSILKAPTDAINTSLNFPGVSGKPIRYWFSQSNMNYEHNSGQYGVLPKFILEDVVMFSLKVILIFQVHRSQVDQSYKTGEKAMNTPPDLFFMVFFASGGVLSSIWTMRTYLRALLDFEAELDEHARNKIEYPNAVSESHLGAEGRLKSLHSDTFLGGFLVFIKKRCPCVRRQRRVCCFKCTCGCLGCKLPPAPREDARASPNDDARARLHSGV
jgi:hypothetical protein